jgi:4-amino-4-deoxy-L-arabinose transferase-like glycosyltransferase
VQDFIERRERTTFWLTLAVFVVFAVYRACVTPLWFDELFTLFIARLSSLDTFLRAMPVDNQPPLGDLLTHIALRLFGQGALAVRLPELLAYAAAGLVTYRIVRRRGTAVQALFGMALLLGANVNKIQAITARPYELMLLMTAIVFACWQIAAERERGRLLPLFGVALGIAGGVLTHHFAIIQIGVLLAAGEAMRLGQRRRLDWPMLVAVAVGLLPLLWTVEIMRQSRMLLGEPILHSAVFWARPGFASLKSYQVMVALPLLWIFLGFALLLWMVKDEAAGEGSGEMPAERTAGAKAQLDSSASSARLKSCPVTEPRHEWAAVIALTLLVPVQTVITAFATNYYLPRYAIGTSLGMALVFAWALPRLGRLRNVGQTVLALSTACFVVSVAVTLLIAQIRRPIWRPQLAGQAESPLLAEAPVGLPIVVANGLDYAPEWWYAPATLQPRLVYLYDVAYAEQKRDPLAELSLSEGQFYIPMSVQPYAPFLAAHPHFLLLAAGNARLLWLPERLADEGWRLQPIAGRGSDVLYRVDPPPAVGHPPPAVGHPPPAVGHPPPAVGQTLAIRSPKPLRSP